MTGYSAYRTRPSAQSPRQEEAMVFRMIARSLKEASGPAERNLALNTNHRVWSGVFRELHNPACTMPDILKNDLLRLSVWSTSYSTRAVLKGLPVDPLIRINLDMAEGLDQADALPVQAAIRNPVVTGSNGFEKKCA